MSDGRGHDAPPQSPSGSVAPPSRAALARWLVVPLVASVALLVASLIAPNLQLDPRVAFGVAYLVVTGSVVGTAVLTPPLARPWLTVALGAVTVLAAVMLVGEGVPLAVRAALVTTALLLGSTAVGSVVGTRVDHPGHLLVVAVVFTLVDTFSVLHPAGPSAAIAQSATAMSVLALPWPMLGTDAIEPLLGLGDVIGATLFVAATRVHGLSLKKTVAALVIGLVAAFATVIATSSAVPVLPFLGFAVVAVHPEARRLRPQDRRVAFPVLGALMLIYAALWAVSR